MSILLLYANYIMASFTAASQTILGSAYTSTTPAYLVTATATATASSNISQEDAQAQANNTAQQIANSQAQNDANIITQTLNISTANVKGEFSFLSFYEAIETDANPYVNPFSGAITPSVEIDVQTNSCVFNIIKPIYTTTTLDPNQIPPTQDKKMLNSNITGSYSLTYKNFPNGGAYIDPTIYGSKVPQPPPNTQSVLTGLRTTYKYITINGTNYNIVIVANVVIYSSILLTKNTTPVDLNSNIINLIIVNKMAQSISTFTVSDNTYRKFEGLNMSETFSPDGNWTYIYSNFTNATLSGSSTNVIYPYSLKQ